MIVMAAGPAVVTYDPATDHWAEAPTPPSIDRQPVALWADGQVVLWDTKYGSFSVPDDGTIVDRGWRWAARRSAWEPLPDLPPGLRVEHGSIGWTGTDIVIWGNSTKVEGLGVGARWHPGDSQWRPVRPSPQGPVKAYDGTTGSKQ